MEKNELLKEAERKAIAALVEGSCPECGYFLPGKYCPQCGLYFGQSPALRCSKGHINGTYRAFCPDCGEDLKAHPPKSWSWWKWLIRGMPF